MKLLALATLCSFASGAELPSVVWRGKNVPLTSLEGEVNDTHYAAVVKHVERYTEWVEANDYRMAVSEDGRVVLIAETAKILKKRMKLVDETLVTFDGLLSPPDRSGSDETFRPGDWGVREHVPDAEPVVLIELTKGAHYQSLLTACEEMEPDVQTWTSIHAAEPGFAEERLMATAWQAAPDGFEVGDVWRSENELVNRLSRLLLHRSFGPQPTWLTQGSAWAVEQEVMGNIYCFPYRREFVGVGEHKGWEPDLKRQFKKRKKSPLALDEFADWERGDWDVDSAMMSWGFVQFLAQHKEGALPALAEANRVAYKAGFTVDHGDGTWSTNPSFAVPQGDQVATLTEVGGAEVFEEASEFFRSWKRYRPAKASSKKRRR